MTLETRREEQSRGDYGLKEKKRDKKWRTNDDIL